MAIYITDFADKKIGELIKKSDIKDGVLRVGVSGGCIGSSARCALTLRYDRTVSPLHARINCVRGAWYLADCASSAGTFLLIPDAGSRVDIGDVVRIGKTEINFFVQVEQEPPA